MVQDQQFAIAPYPSIGSADVQNSEPVLDSHAIPCLLIFLPMRHHNPLGVLRGRFASSSPKGSNGSGEASWAFLCIREQ